MNRRSPFTLVELLIVVAIIAILVAMLLPALSAAKSAAKLGACMANFKSLGEIMVVDAGDNDRKWRVFHSNSGITNDEIYVTAKDNAIPLLQYGLQTNSPTVAAEQSVTWTVNRGTRDSILNCPESDQPSWQFTTTGTFQAAHTHVFLTGLDDRQASAGYAGADAFYGDETVRRLSDGMAPLATETCRGGGGSYWLTNKHPQEKMVHVFSDGSVHAVPASNFITDSAGIMSPKLNVWGFGPPSWMYFWAESDQL